MTQNKSRALIQRAHKLLVSNRIDEAGRIASQLCQSDYGNASVWCLMATLHGQVGRLKESEQCSRRAVGLDPQNFQAYFLLGNVHRAQGELSEAIANYKKALSINPRLIQVYALLGDVLVNRGRPAKAVKWLTEAVKRQPDFIQAHITLASAYHALGQYKEANAKYDHVLQIDPDNTQVWFLLAATVGDQGKLDEALVYYQKVLSRTPGDSATRSNLLLTLNYMASADPGEVYAEHLRWDAAHGQVPTVGHGHTNVRDAERLLRVGYVSPDFRTHSVAYFIEPLLAGHTPALVETVCYSDTAQPDATTERLRGLAGGWRNIYGQPDEQVVEQIRADGIDILVDLSGHTAGNRLKVFAHKPAPVQVTYLGYPNTTGMEAMDYRLTDAWADPPGETERYHSEELVRLPHGFLCYRPAGDAPAVGSVPSEAAGYVTFGSFNNLAKMTPEVVEVWSSILQAVPGSRLLLKNKSLKDESTRARYRDLFAAHGIVRDRLDMRAVVASNTAHLGLYGEVDIALDTFPYNGTTTTCEALWMGVPVVTLAGRTHAGRVGVSLLTQTGLEDQVAKNREEYIEKAVCLSADRALLSELRTGLRQSLQASTLLDEPGFVRQVEHACRDMWIRWCQE